mgnify:FL=1
MHVLGACSLLGAESSRVRKTADGILFEVAKGLQLGFASRSRQEFFQD